jgi:hypothetical protein
MKKKMLQSFFNMQIAENTFISRYDLISASKNVPCAQSILKQEPEEHFMSFLHWCFPQPFESLMYLSRTNKMKICTSGGKRRPPSVTPNVIGIRVFEVIYSLRKNQRLIEGILWKWQLKKVVDVHCPGFTNWNEFQSCKGEQVWKSLTRDWITPRIMPKGTSTSWLY